MREISVGRGSPRDAERFREHFIELQTELDIFALAIEGVRSRTAQDQIAERDVEALLAILTRVSSHINQVEELIVAQGKSHD
jgi:hypothetical protein